MFPPDTRLRDYLKYRGRCRQMSELAVKDDPTLTLVRGHYICPIWGKQPHWWTVRKDGSIFDPTARQFPSKGRGEYVPFDGWFNCSNCDKRIREEEGHVEGNYIFCSNLCHGIFIGLLDEDGNTIETEF